MIKSLIRQIIRPLSYWFYYYPNKNSLNKNINGKKLKNGISAVISMKNEEYTIGSSIKSLVGIADQIICIDNGSTDSSITEVKKVIKELEDKVEIELYEMPNALLGECRNFGLSKSRYQWHLRWDADMIAIDDGENNMKKLRTFALNCKKPASIQFGYVNLNGDFKHTVKGHEFSFGEPYLIYYNQEIFYQEIQKFDVIKVPKYYNIIKTNKIYFFHCGGLKSDENLIHRFHYFTWRKFTINHENFNLKKDDFIKKRNKYLFDTVDPNKVKYRYQKQNVYRFIPYKEDGNFKYPKIILKLLEINGNRFEVTYKNNQPISRIDHQDMNMKNFIADDNDENWNTDSFFLKLSNEDVSIYL